MLFADVVPDSITPEQYKNAAIWIGIAILVLVVVGSKIYLAYIEDDHDD